MKPILLLLTAVLLTPIAAPSAEPVTIVAFGDSTTLDRLLNEHP